MQMATRPSLFKAAAVLAVVFAALIGVTANQDQTDKPAVPDATVNFGPVLPQPPPPANHVLVPDEVTIFKGGTVTFIVNGGGHGIGVYPVSRSTTRADIEEDLCQGGPAVCNATAGTQNQQYLITDGDGNLIIDTGVNPPENRVNYAPGQNFSAGAGAFLVGSTTTAAGTQVRYRFAEDGRYLVICINRGHSLNDWMFGFVNVV